MKLHKLYNGNWVDLSTVRAIRGADRSECWPGGPIHPARIIIHHGDRGESIDVIPCDDMAQPAQMMDELAGLVNSIAK